MNHFGKNARKLTRFENNRAQVDFLYCKNGYRDAAAIQMKTKAFRSRMDFNNHLDDPFLARFDHLGR